MYRHLSSVGNAHWRGFTNIFLVFLSPWLYLIACAVSGALLSYPLHFVLPESLDYQTLVFKSGELLLALGLIPLARFLGIGRNDMGLDAPFRQLSRQVMRGLGWGAFMLGLHVLLLVALDVRVLNPERMQVARIISLTYKGVILGLLIALLEEPIFRGFLFGFLLKKTSKAYAVLVASFYFALLHFLSTDLRPEFTDVGWNTSFHLMLDAFKNLFNVRLDAFIALFAAGAFLCCIRLYCGKSGLSYCIGVHAGWVFIIKTANPLTIRSIVSPLQSFVSSFDGNIGYLSAAWTSLLIIGFATKMHRHMRSF